MKGQARHAQFNAFKKLARSAGFGRIRQADLRTRATVATAAAQEAAADVGWSLDFFGDAAGLPVAHRTKEPNIKADTPAANEYLFCARALSLEVAHQTTTFTAVELMEIASKLSHCVLQLVSGTDNIFEKRAGYILAGDVGIDARTDGQAAPTTVRGRLHSMREGDDLDDPLIIFPGASVKAVLNGEGAWTTTDDIVLTLNLHGWLAYKGSVEAGSRVLSLQDALENPSLMPRQH